eukprot:459076-Rhodomonas_salina.1
MRNTKHQRKRPTCTHAMKLNEGESMRGISPATSTCQQLRSETPTPPRHHEKSSSRMSFSSFSSCHHRPGQRSSTPIVRIISWVPVRAPQSLLFRRAS